MSFHRSYESPFHLRELYATPGPDASDAVADWYATPGPDASDAVADWREAINENDRMHALRLRAAADERMHARSSTSLRAAEEAYQAARYKDHDARHDLRPNRSYGRTPRAFQASVQVQVAQDELGATETSPYVDRYADLGWFSRKVDERVESAARAHAKGEIAARDASKVTSALAGEVLERDAVIARLVKLVRADRDSFDELERAEVEAILTEIADAREAKDEGRRLKSQVEALTHDVAVAREAEVELRDANEQLEKHRQELLAKMFETSMAERRRLLAHIRRHPLFCSHFSATGRGCCADPKVS